MRGDAQAAFLAAQGWGDALQEPLPGDASGRRYVRLRRGAHTRMLMDWPPVAADDGHLRPFVEIAAWLRAQGLSAPEIDAVDDAQGFILLEDLGEARFDEALARGLPEAELYAHATDALALLAQLAPPNWLPPYDDDALMQEAQRFLDGWPAAANMPAFNAAARLAFEQTWREAWKTVAASRSAPVLLDVHAHNLMWLPDRKGVARVGLIDFQDARRGHAAYDLASLVDDVRRTVSPALADALRARFLGVVDVADRDGFLASAAILSAQRATKILGIFGRLTVQGRGAYAGWIPRTWDVLARALAHPALAGPRAWFDTHAPAETRRVDPRILDQVA